MYVRFKTESKGVQSTGTSSVPIVPDTGCFLIVSENFLDSGPFVTLLARAVKFKAFYAYVGIEI